MKRFYPWRLFRKYTLNYLTFGVLAVALVMILMSETYQVPMVTWPQLYVFIVAFGFVLSASLLMAHFSASPMRRVILKALKISSRKKFAATADEDEELFDEEPGEYFELEQALEKINKKIKKRRQQLAHEREETQTLMGTIEDAIVSVNSTGHISFFNSSFAAQFLSSSLLERYRQNIPISFAETIRDPEVLLLYERALNHSEVGRLQMNYVTNLGTGVRHLSLIVSPLKEERQRLVYGVLFLFHDVTEAKRAEKIRTEFVENASHELRTPLTSIKGYLSTLKDDLEAKRMEQVPFFMKALTKSVDRLMELVNDLLTISALDQHTALKLENISLEQLTQEVIERMMNLATAKKIMIKTQIPALSLFADPSKLEQVLMNLLGNAIKYTQEGGVVQVRWQDEGDGRMRLSVKDNGPGISEEHLPRLFERFYRVDKGRSRDVGGTGLGLSIVKHIVLNHGGSVHVNSQAGQGSEFICFFPSRPERQQLSL